MASQLTPQSIYDYLDELLAAGADLDELVSRLNPCSIRDNLVNILLVAGANPDNLASCLGDDVVYYLDELLAAGAKIDVDELAGQLTPQSIYDCLDELLAAGADPELLQSYLNSSQ